VLETGACSSERQPILASETDSGERTLDAAVRAARRNPQGIELFQCLPAYLIRIQPRGCYFDT